MRPGPQVYVQTRGTGRAGDYTFLCGAPPHPWWRAYRDATAFDHPTVLVRSDGAGWQAYLSGIPSARVDAVGTVVRYTLVLDGGSGDGTIAPLLPTAVATWLDDVAEALAGPPGRRLSAALDARLPADDVQRWIDAGEPPATSPACGTTAISEPGRRVLEALASLPARTPADDLPGSWVGGVGSAPARAAFVARVGELVSGAPGRALLLNLVGGPDDATAVLDPGSPVAVLVDGAAPDRPIPLQGEVDAKKAPTPRPRRAGAAAVAMGVLAMLAVLLAAVLLLLL